MKVYALRQEASLREIGEALGLSFERVRQIEHEALRKLQGPRSRFVPRGEGAKLGLAIVPPLRRERARPIVSARRDVHVPLYALAPPGLEALVAPLPLGRADAEMFPCSGGGLTVSPDSTSPRDAPASGASDGAPRLAPCGARWLADRGGAAPRRAPLAGPAAVTSSTPGRGRRAPAPSGPLWGSAPAPGPCGARAPRRPSPTAHGSTRRGSRARG